MQKNKNKVIIFFIYKGDGESWQADFYLVFKVVVFNGQPLFWIVTQYRVVT